MSIHNTHTHTHTRQHHHHHRHHYHHNIPTSPNNVVDDLNIRKMNEIQFMCVCVCVQWGWLDYRVSNREEKEPTTQQHYYWHESHTNTQWIVRFCTMSHMNTMSHYNYCEWLLIFAITVLCCLCVRSVCPSSSTSLFCLLFLLLLAIHCFHYIHCITLLKSLHE